MELLLSIVAALIGILLMWLCLWAVFYDPGPRLSKDFADMDRDQWEHPENWPGIDQIDR